MHLNGCSLGTMRDTFHNEPVSLRRKDFRVAWEGLRFEISKVPASNTS